MSSYKFHLATDTSSCLGHNFLIAFKTTLDQGLGLPVLFVFCFRSQISLVMRSLGFEQSVRKVGGKSKRVWVRTQKAADLKENLSDF